MCSSLSVCILVDNFSEVQIGSQRGTLPSRPITAECRQPGVYFVYGPLVSSRHGTGSHFVTQRPSDPGIQRPGDPVDPVTLFYNELQMSTYVADKRLQWARGLTVFTARCYASAVLAMGLCPSLSVSVTSRSSTKTAKRRITQTTPHDSPVTLVF